MKRNSGPDWLEGPAAKSFDRHGEALPGISSGVALNFCKLLVKIYEERIGDNKSAVLIWKSKAESKFFVLTVKRERVEGGSSQYYVDLGTRPDDSESSRLTMLVTQFLYGLNDSGEPVLRQASSCLKAFLSEDDFRNMRQSYGTTAMGAPRLGLEELLMVVKTMDLARHPRDMEISKNALVKQLEGYTDRDSPEETMRILRGRLTVLERAMGVSQRVLDDQKRHIDLLKSRDDGRLWESLREEKKRNKRLKIMLGVVTAIALALGVGFYLKKDNQTIADQDREGDVSSEILEGMQKNGKFKVKLY